MDYREYAAPDGLRAHVDCLWTSQPATDRQRARSRHRVLPDGCIDLLIQGDGTARVVGAMTTAVIVTPEQPLVAVRFRPGGARALFGGSATAWTNTEHPLRTIWRDANKLIDHVLTASRSTERARRLGVALAARAAGAAPVSAAVGAAEHLLSSVAPPTVAELAESQGVSRQFFTRRFRDHVGIAPQQFGRIARLARLREIWEQHPQLALVDTALLAGYHDQAHMGHDVQELAGTTPRMLRRDGLTVND